MLNAVTTSKPSSTGANSSHTDANLYNSTVADSFRAQWIISQATAGTTAGETAGQISRIISNSSVSVFNYLPALTTKLTTGDEYEIWTEDFPPARINDFINRAIMDVTRKGAIPVTETSIHTGAGLYSYGLSSSVAGVHRIEYREVVEAEILAQDVTWGEQIATNVASSLDDEDYRIGVGSQRWTIAGAFTTGVLSGYLPTAVDLRGMTHIEGWLKTNVATSGTHLTIGLSASSDFTTPLETVAIPALTTTNEWKFTRVALSSAAAMSTIGGIFATLTSDLGAQTIWANGFRTVRADTELWTEVPRRYWRLDTDTRQIVFTQEGKDMIGYSLLKVWTVQRPTLPATESATIGVDPEYVIYRTAAMALRSRGDRKADRREADYQQADIYDRIAEQKRLSVQVPDGVRWLAI